jgi:heme/copper-type cytochrome/quinol oxidase subunit 3
MTAYTDPAGEPTVRPKLDVSALHTSAFDSAAPAWWGNVLMMCIETTTVVLLLVTYVYLWANNFGREWPPPQVHAIPPIVRPYPELKHATWDAVLVVLSCLPMYLTDRAARRRSRPGVLLGLFLMLATAGVLIWLRFMELPDLHVKWNENAYGSIVWWTLVMHLTYLATGAGEFLIMWLYLFCHRLDDKHALDVTLAGGFWYWITGTWLAIYFVLYWLPRMVTS